MLKRVISICTSIILLNIFSIAVFTQENMDIEQAVGCFDEIVVLPVGIDNPNSSNIYTNKFKISGYIKPEAEYTGESYCEGFKVHISEIGISALTDRNGFFVFDGIPEKSNPNGYTISITKTGYVTRTVIISTLNKDTEVGSQSQPVSMTLGDINNDGTVNSVDIIEVAKAFNEFSSSPKFNKDADLNNDGTINFIDVIIIAKYFNKSSSNYSQPFIAGLSYITIGKDEFFIKEKGLYKDFMISDNNVMQLEPESKESRWIFRAVSQGISEIILKPMLGDIHQKYIITVTKAVKDSPTPTPVKESPANHFHGVFDIEPPYIWEAFKLLEVLEEEVDPKTSQIDLDKAINKK